ncbi:MAG TPA: threonine--tRNA ligase [Candidatus Magasanikbacteria bacterium]|nr:threonine--tRNA ligase [Candidatus Magasanikbacteria bacterium]
MENNLEVMRHSCAHLVAAAVAELYPGAKFGVGPVVENGFYYDIDFPQNITEEDLKNIEDKAHELSGKGLNFVRREMDIATAITYFSERKQDYKVALLQDIQTKGTTKMNAEEIQDVGTDTKNVSVYETGDFVDLCRGPHVASSKDVGVFKLVKLAGAYWRGDANNKQLQRIYGICFETQGELDSYLNLLEEAKKRDHRKLGVELDLFTFSDLVGPGLALWTPRGTLLRNVLDDYVWDLRRERGYERVTIPHITKKALYETSGHWQKFAEELFHITTREGHEFAMKPMNCPHHTQIYNHISRSYRELPQRYAETTMVYRDEQSGELSGLSRVRCITQDDAHVFLREVQVKEEMFKIWDIIEIFYRATGFSSLKVRLSLHDPDHFEKYLGTKDVWEKTENQLRELAKERGAEYFEAKGEAAMYGPKVDFMATDSLGREWQVATVQIDRNLPERFDLTCVNEKGEKERIVMLHAAIMGSIERFLSILIEHHAGAFPIWMSPTQVMLTAVSAKHVEGARQIAAELAGAGVRVEVDDADETLGNKIRKSAGRKIPYVIVVGDKELAGGDWMIRVRGEKDQIKMTKNEFIAKLKLEIAEKK